MSALEKIQRSLKTIGDTLATLVKVPLMSGRPSPKGSKDLGTVIIMGNGPSLKEAMSLHRDVLEKYPRLAVNFSALTPEIFALKPDYYLLADIAFFLKEKTGNVPRLWETLSRIDWPMTLFLPVRARRMPEVKRLPANITVKWFNLTPAEGWRPLIHAIYRSGIAMPRPRNVIVPSIMSLMREGFSKIVLIGADHNWSKTLWVTDRNRVVSVQPHFYEDDDAELLRAEEIFKNVHIHDVYENYAIAFRSYFNVKDYAQRRGVEILNATPGSFIDAFPRINLGDLA